MMFFPICSRRGNKKRGRVLPSSFLLALPACCKALCFVLQIRVAKVGNHASDQGNTASDRIEKIKDLQGSKPRKSLILQCFLLAEKAGFEPVYEVLRMACFLAPQLPVLHPVLQAFFWRKPPPRNRGLKSAVCSPSVMG